MHDRATTALTHDIPVLAAMLEALGGPARPVHLGGLRLHVIWDHEAPADRAYVLAIGTRAVPRIDGATEFAAADMAALLASVGVTPGRLAAAIGKTVA